MYYLFGNALVHVIYSGVSGQCSYTIHNINISFCKLNTFCWLTFLTNEEKRYNYKNIHTEMLRSPLGMILNRPPVMRFVSLYQVTSGSGFPVTEHVIRTEWPSATLIDGGGGTRMVGASSESKKQTCNIVGFTALKILKLHNIDWCQKHIKWVCTVW